MPRSRKASRNDVESHLSHANTLTRINESSNPRKMLLQLLEDGHLEVEESSFSDPGEDYTALVDAKIGERLTYWPGY